jgi:catechol 2,3-dioxygenase-like lactoylglutathione lyase family enzyme
MQSLVLFLSGIMVGALLLSTGSAQERAQPRRLNHVGITTRHYEQALEFYKKTLGAREAFTLRRDDGSVRLTYLQLSRDTFVELLAVTDDQPGGVVHFGFETDDVAASVAGLRARGVAVTEPTVGFTRSRIARVTDPDGVQIEVMQSGPDSMQRKAIDAWK